MHEAMITQTHSKISLEVDTTSQFYKYLRVEDNTLSVLPGYTNWFPIFLSGVPLKDKQFFEVSITVAGNNNMMVGINLSSNRKKNSTCLKAGSMLLSMLGDNGCFINGAECKDFSLTGVDGARLQVRVDLLVGKV